MESTDHISDNFNIKIPSWPSGQFYFYLIALLSKLNCMQMIPRIFDRSVIIICHAEMTDELTLILEEYMLEAKQPQE